MRTGLANANQVARWTPLEIRDIPCHWLVEHFFNYPPRPHFAWLQAMLADSQGEAKSQLKQIQY